MIYEKILVPFDGSEPSRGALSEAAKIARADDATEIYVLRVIDLSQIMQSRCHGVEEERDVPAGTGEFQELQDSVVNEISKEMHESFEDILDDNKNRVQVDLVDASDPVPQIVDYAKTHGCDLIVMGSRGLGLFRGMLGSVSNGVLHQSVIPVMVVR